MAQIQEEYEFFLIVTHIFTFKFFTDIFFKYIANLKDQMHMIRKLNNLYNYAQRNYSHVSGLMIKKMCYDDLDLGKIEQFWDDIEENLKHRKQKVDIPHLKNLIHDIRGKATDSAQKKSIEEEITNIFLSLPNITCPKSINLIEPKVLRNFNSKIEIENPLSLQHLSPHGVDMSTGNFTGSRSFYLRGSMAKLENSLTW